MESSCCNHTQERKELEDIVRAIFHCVREYVGLKDEINFDSKEVSDGFNM